MILNTGNVGALADFARGPQAQFKDILLGSLCHKLLTGRYPVRMSHAVDCDGLSLLIADIKTNKRK